MLLQPAVECQKTLHANIDSGNAKIGDIPGWIELNTKLSELVRPIENLIDFVTNERFKVLTPAKATPKQKATLAKQRISDRIAQLDPRLRFGYFGPHFLERRIFRLDEYTIEGIQEEDPDVYPGLKKAYALFIQNLPEHLQQICSDWIMSSTPAVVELTISSSQQKSKEGMFASTVAASSVEARSKQG